MLAFLSVVCLAFAGMFAAARLDLPKYPHYRETRQGLAFVSAALLVVAIFLGMLA